MKEEMSYQLLNRRTLHHNKELQYLINNPKLHILIPIGFQSDSFESNVFMISHKLGRRGIWLKESEGELLDNLLDTNRFRQAMENYLHRYHIPSEAVMKTCLKFDIQNGI